MIGSFEQSFSDLDVNASDYEMRKRAWERFIELGLPHKKSEAYQYVPLSYEEHKSACEVEASAQLVFIDGVFRKDLSTLEGLSDEIEIMPLSQARTAYGALLDARANVFEKEVKDPYFFLGAALKGDGLFIYVPPRINAGTLSSIHLSTSGTPTFESIHLFMGRGAKARWTMERKEQRGLAHYGLEMTLEDEAQLQIQRLHPYTPEAWTLSNVRAELKKGSRLTISSANFGGASQREAYDVILRGEGGYAELKGLAALKEKRQAHTHVRVRHAAPGCISKQLFKHALAQVSRASFSGMIYVDAIAQQTEAYQLSSSLLLDEGAIAYSKPGLEIFADDVRASHGATVAQVDDKDLFYLQSRGITKADAERLLIRGFCQEAASGISGALRHIEEFLTRK